VWKLGEARPRLKESDRYASATTSEIPTITIPGPLANERRIRGDEKAIHHP